MLLENSLSFFWRLLSQMVVLNVVFVFVTQGGDFLAQRGCDFARCCSRGRKKRKGAYLEIAHDEIANTVKSRFHRAAFLGHFQPALTA